MSAKSRIICANQGKYDLCKNTIYHEGCNGFVKQESAEWCGCRRKSTKFDSRLTLIVSKIAFHLTSGNPAADVDDDAGPYARTANGARRRRWPLLAQLFGHYWSVNAEDGGEFAFWVNFGNRLQQTVTISKLYSLSK